MFVEEKRGEGAEIIIPAPARRKGWPGRISLTTKDTALGHRARVHCSITGRENIVTTPTRKKSFCYKRRMKTSPSVNLSGPQEEMGEKRKKGGVLTEG